MKEEKHVITGKLKVEDTHLPAKIEGWEENAAKHFVKKMPAFTEEEISEMEAANRAKFNEIREVLDAEEAESTGEDNQGDA